MINSNINLNEINQQLNKYKVLYRVLKLENDNLKYNYRVLYDQNQVLIKNNNELLFIKSEYERITSNRFYRFFRKIYRGLKKILGRK